MQSLVIDFKDSFGISFFLLEIVLLVILQKIFSSLLKLLLNSSIKSVYLHVAIAFLFQIIPVIRKLINTDHVAVNSKLGKFVDALADDNLQQVIPYEISDFQILHFE